MITMLQAPPNLTPSGEGAEAETAMRAGWKALLDSGINDWGEGAGAGQGEGGEVVSKCSGWGWLEGAAGQWHQRLG